MNEGDRGQQEGLRLRCKEMWSCLAGCLEGSQWRAWIVMLVSFLNIFGMGLLLSNTLLYHYQTFGKVWHTEKHGVNGECVYKSYAGPDSHILVDVSWEGAVSVGHRLAIGWNTEEMLLWTWGNQENIHKPSEDLKKSWVTWLPQSEKVRRPCRHLG